MIVNDRAEISSEMPLTLAQAFDTTPESWLNLQQQYSLWEYEREIDTSRVRNFTQPYNKREY